MALYIIFNNTNTEILNAHNRVKNLFDVEINIQLNIVDGGIRVTVDNSDDVASRYLAFLLKDLQSGKRNS